MSWELHLGHGKGSGDVELAGRVAAEEGECAVFIFFMLAFLFHYMLICFSLERKKSWYGLEELVIDWFIYKMSCVGCLSYFRVNCMMTNFCLYERKNGFVGLHDDLDYI